MSTKLDISVASVGDWMMATVRGELDMASSADLEATCLELDGDVAVDLAGVQFIDSSGLAALLRLSHRDGRCVLLNPSDPVLRLFEITKVTNRFDIRDALA
ncbi:MAG: STAS domain-containing protein [Acidimicrobiia bacterium]